MSHENCPYCDGKFDSQKNRYPTGLLSFFRIRSPSESMDDQFTVRCPHCGMAYVSDSVKFLGLITRKYYFLSLLLLILLVCALTLLAS